MEHHIIYVGLDVHKETIAVALAGGGQRGEVREHGKVANTPNALKTLGAKLARNGARLRFCYEAGPCGYGIQRQLSEAGHECVVVAPSLIPRKPGDRIKTDRRDAINLAKLHRAGELTSVWVPDPPHEAIRDLVRARLAAVRVLRQARQQLSGFLLRHGHHYNRPAWTLMHRRWLAGLKFEHAAHYIVLEDCIATVEAATARRDRLEAHIDAALADWSLAPVVKALQSLRGLALVAAATLVAEPGDITRFANPRQFMAYLGLVPSEHSSGGTRRQGGITKGRQWRGKADVDRGCVELPVSITDQSRSPPASGGLDQTDPGYRLEGSGTSVSTVPQTDARGKTEDRRHRRDRARAFGLRLGHRQGGASHGRMTRRRHW